LENVLQWYERTYGLHSVCLRYFNASGADPAGELGESHDMETHLIPLAIRSVLTGSRLRIFGTNYPTLDGSAVRDYVHVSDLADAHVRALRYLAEGGKGTQFNCGTGIGHSVWQVLRKIEEVSGKCVAFESCPRRQGDAPALIADSCRIRESLGWEPKYSSLDAIVQTAWRWYTEFSGRSETSCSVPRLGR